MTRRIHYTWGTSQYRFNVTDGIRLRLDVDQVEDITDKVFAYLLQPLSSEDGTKRAMFSHVCSPVDLEEYPEDEPIEGHLPEYFRLNYVDIVLRSEHEIAEFLATLEQDLRSLKRTLDVMDTLTTEGDTWIESAPDDSSSSSSVSP